MKTDAKPRLKPTEYNEGKEAAERFKAAMKTVLRPKAVTLKPDHKSKTA